MGKNNVENSKPPRNYPRRFSSFVYVGGHIVRAIRNVAVATIIAVLVSAMVADAFALKPERVSARVSISSPSELPWALFRAGIIRFPWLFSAYTAVGGGEIKAGSAEVNSKMDYRELLRAFGG